MLPRLLSGCLPPEYNDLKCGLDGQVDTEYLEKLLIHNQAE